MDAGERIRTRQGGRRMSPVESFTFEGFVGRRCKRYATLTETTKRTQKTGPLTQLCLLAQTTNRFPSRRQPRVCGPRDVARRRFCPSRYHSMNETLTGRCPTTNYSNRACLTRAQPPHPGTPPWEARNRGAAATASQASQAPKGVRGGEDPPSATRARWGWEPGRHLPISAGVLSNE